MIDVFTFDPCPARGKIEKVTQVPFAAEAKLDGVRAILARSNATGEITLTGRRNSDRTGQKLNKIDSVPHLLEFGEKLVRQGYKDFVLDGELCLITKDGQFTTSNEVVSIMGSSTEKALAKQNETGLLTYVAFDLLYLLGNGDCRDYRNDPYCLRRGDLETLIGRYGLDKVLPVPVLGDYDGNSSLTPSEYVAETFAKATDVGLEGLILKTHRGPYHHLQWAKVKGEQTYDMVIIGTQDSEAETFAGNGIAAFQLALYDSAGRLMPVTMCSGMTHEIRRDAYENPSDYVGEVVEVKAQLMFKDTGALRHPRFIKLRTDLDPKEQTFAKYGVREG